MEPIRERGTILQVDGDACVVRLEGEDTERCRQCGLCAAAAQKAAEQRILRVEAAGPRAIGATVIVEIVQPDRAVAALLVFGLPSAFIGAFAGGAGWAAWALGWPPTIPALIAGVLGAAAGLACVKAVDRAWRRRGAYRARIVEEAEPPG